MPINITKINALSELERYGWKSEPSGANEVKCQCPVHDDKVASLSLNVEKNLWICHASHCKASGDIISLLAYIGRVERKTILADLEKRYPGLVGKKSINIERIEKWHQAIWNSGPYLQELYKRGVTDDDIREHRLGFSLKEERIMIPVFDRSGAAINVRKYKPGAPGPDKVRNISGYQSRAIYLINQLKYPTIWLCGGEMKSIVAKRILNPSNIGAINFTGAEGAWAEELTDELKGKIVFVCMDVDAGGRVGARRVATQIYSKAQSVYIINLSLFLDAAKYPKGDINNWVADEKAGIEDFSTAMKMAVKYVPPYFQEQDDSKIPVEDCTLLEARKSEAVGKKLKTSFIVNMLDTKNYLVPKELSVSCTRDAECCHSCIVNSKEVNENTGRVEVVLKPINAEFLALIGISQKKVPMLAALLDAMGIPECKSAKIEIISYYNIADVRLGEETDLEINAGKTDVNQPAFVVGLTEEQIELNTPYVGICRNFPDPTEGSAVLLITQLDRKEDSLSSFTLTEKDFTLLKIFKCSYD